ncbi:MAG: polyphosphate polymerase domain-containing protein [Defluviitaleaceae bacterium]|nr:polyphosphate polymerase domain-containing protein [Defluviitaleaceae bacterium]
MQAVFKRHEKKYLITSEQAQNIQSILPGRMTPDGTGTYWVQNIYFDNNRWDVINISMDKPYFKEKMRLRCYGDINTANHVFLELKKKYAGIVYKRRVALPKQALDIPLENALESDDSQIARELKFYLQTAQVSRKMFLSYRRAAFMGMGENSPLRITFDSTIRYRTNKLDFIHSPKDGSLVFPENAVIMEIKTPFSIPLWLARFLSENKIFGTSVSKYGVCFSDFFQKTYKGAVGYV